MVQHGMQSQLKVLQSEQAKVKSAGKVGTATEELQCVINFNSSITQCMVKARENLSDFVFCLHVECHPCEKGLISGTC